MAAIKTVVRVEQEEPVMRVRLVQRFAGRTMQSICIHLVDGLLIDTGCAHSVPEVLQLLAGRRLEQVVNTHHHEDHIGANAALTARYGLLPQIHPAGLPYIQHPGPIGYYRRLTWGTPEPSAGVPLGPVVETQHHRFSVIHTPGHAPDHVALYEERQGWLFTGDLFLAPRVKLGTPFDDPWQILASLNRLRELEIDRLYCGHGRVFKGKEAAQALQERVRYWEWLAGESGRLRDQGLSVRAISRRLLGPEPFMFYFTMGEFSKCRLIRQLLRSPEESRLAIRAGWEL
ncbi:MAG TPA: MBL fold metallo-hydrolase [Symbiobacteriaceae bacterium]|jgi:glyoxylase-like metal-dependent hydrolase (beta-lactamase superfamily II)